MTRPTVFLWVLHSHSLPRAHQFPHPWTARLQRCPVQHRANHIIIVGSTWSKYKFTKDKGRFTKWLPQKEKWIPWSFMLFWERLEFPKPHTSWCPYMNLKKKQFPYPPKKGLPHVPSGFPFFGRVGLSNLKTPWWIYVGSKMVTPKIKSFHT